MQVWRRWLYLALFSSVHLVGHALPLLIADFLVHCFQQLPQSRASFFHSKTANLLCTARTIVTESQEDQT